MTETQPPKSMRASRVTISQLILPVTLPLAPLMKELTHSMVDVLSEEPQRLHTLDSGELREDLD